MASLRAKFKDYEVHVPTETVSNGYSPDMADELTRRFQSIELLFNVMGAADSGVQGVFVRQWAEIGICLALNFREYLDKILDTSKGKQQT